MEYLANLVSELCIFVIEVAALDLLIGYAGILSFGHAAFIGIGAYATAIVLTSFHVGCLVALTATLGVTALVALAVGLPTLRLSGDYFILGTLGLSIIASTIFQNWVDVTNGPFGIYGIPKLSILGLQISTPIQFSAVAVIVTAFVLLLKHALVSSPYGVTLRVVREDDVVARALGKNVTVIRVVVFALASALASIGGLLTAYNLRFIDPSLFGVELTIFLWAALFVGGCASIAGNIIGPLMLFGIPEALRFTGLDGALVAHLRDLLYGALLILVTMFRPQGIAGTYRFR
jgi:branched-chain amino acid transport system permease protein